MLPLGVVIPTKNSMKYLPGHLENLATWIDLAEQVVVVDSFSTDGTLEFIRANLHHPNLHIVSHPPGLYASWNHGIRQLTSEYCYISTVGDSITRAGLEHLVATASRLNCDVLVSHPDFINEAGQLCASWQWPMDFIIERLNLKEPTRVVPAVVLAVALLHKCGAITGSCASDLFRTDVLQQNPFPLDFGTAGDGAWSLQNAGRARWAVTPERMTTFRIHPPSASTNEVKTGWDVNRFPQIAVNAATQWLELKLNEAPGGSREKIEQLVPLAYAYLELHRRYNSLRKTKWPWILNPSVWQLRSKRNQLRSQVIYLAQNIFDQYRLK